MIARKSQKVVVDRDCSSARSAKPACQIEFSRDKSGRSAVTGGEHSDQSGSANERGRVNRRASRDLKAPTSYPPWVVLHVPHDSTDVPPSVREQFLLDDSKLASELNRMTDRHTMALFAEPEIAARVVRAPVSRLVVDVERFVDDDHEPMADRGMGCVYTATSGLERLRRPLTATERESLVQAYYLPHHARLEAAVEANIQRHGHCLAIDCHSFPNRALPYEQASNDAPRVDICIGTDEFHTSSRMESAFVAEFKRAGFSVAVNDPFAGALVPISRYRQDRSVSAIMVEVNRHLYMDEASGDPLPWFNNISRKIKSCCIAALVAEGHLHGTH